MQKIAGRLLLSCLQSQTLWGMKGRWGVAEGNGCPAWKGELGLLLEGIGNKQQCCARTWLLRAGGLPGFWGTVLCNNMHGFTDVMGFIPVLVRE